MFKRVALSARRRTAQGKSWVRRVTGRERLVVSVPQAGTTWVSVLMQAALSVRDGRPLSAPVFTNTPLDGFSLRPHVTFTHDGFVATDASTAAVVEQAKKNPTAMIVRDFRDVIVPVWFSSRFRVREGNVAFAEGLDEFLNQRYDLRKVVDVMNAWAEHPNLYIIRYEELHADGASVLGGLLSHFGIDGVTGEMLRRAVRRRRSKTCSGSRHKAWA
jgi:hypothetical protein